MAKQRGIDWKPIKAEYIATNISLRKLAEKYGIGTTELFKRSSKENWTELRSKNSSRTVAMAVQKAGKAEANHLAKLIDATSKAIGVAVGAFEDEQQFNRYIISEGIGAGATQTEERIYAKIDTKALKDLTGVIKDLTGLMRDFYNIPTAAQAEARRIAAERLEIERRKAEAMVNDVDDDETGVVMIPEVDENA